MNRRNRLHLEVEQLEDRLVLDHNPFHTGIQNLQKNLDRLRGGVQGLVSSLPSYPRKVADVGLAFWGAAQAFRGNVREGLERTNRALGDYLDSIIKDAGDLLLGRPAQGATPPASNIVARYTGQATFRARDGSVHRREIVITVTRIAGDVWTGDIQAQGEPKASFNLKLVGGPRLVGKIYPPGTPPFDVDWKFDGNKIEGKLPFGFEFSAKKQK